MREENIQQMNFKELRAQVQLLRDELAIFKRKYEDAIYNLDDNNFCGKLLKEKEQMRTEISITADGIKTKVSKTDLDEALTEYSTIEQTAINIALAVNSEREYADGQYASLSSRISVEKDRISSIIRGEYTGDLLDGYLTGIEITPHSIKMIDDPVYSVYNRDGLIFYDEANQKEGWAIQPDRTGVGGKLNYYVNDVACFSISRPAGGASIDIKALNSMIGQLVMDMEDSGYPEIKFIVGNHSNGSPLIYVNEQLLATQDWVLENGGGSTVAVFG
ncbi:MAG: hypothetical protein PUF08_03110 [Clostridiales bacterium]|nr:hypothetical protein [Clostridiales bacterium]